MANLHFPQIIINRMQPLKNNISSSNNFSDKKESDNQKQNDFEKILQQEIKKYKD